ncbi:MAG: four helix bundle protein [Caldiserica bacterium]|nr:MAG: four helix bundle protein [Caldisericota bacterium]
MDKKIENLKERSFRFAIEIINLVRRLSKSVVEREIGRQILRSGCSIGANIEEAFAAYTKKEFSHLMNIAKREAKETRYWLRLIKETNIFSQNEKIENLLEEIDELSKILYTVVKKVQRRVK